MVRRPLSLAAPISISPARSLLAAGSLVWMLVVPMTAGAGDKYAGEFLHVGAGARAIGMGGAFIAIADDASAAYWNPAGLPFLGKHEILYQHSEQFRSAVNYD